MIPNQIAQPTSESSNAESAAEVLEDALALEAAGVFSVVVEGVPGQLRSDQPLDLHLHRLGCALGDFPEADLLAFAVGGDEQNTASAVGVS
mgnify:CR=1 FL=1